MRAQKQGWSAQGPACRLRYLWAAPICHARSKARLKCRAARRRWSSLSSAVLTVQGREKEVVIFSAVRSAARCRARIGFVADERRINVGLTRARTSLLLVGNLSVLKGDAHWAALIRHATAEGCVLTVQLLHVRPCSDDWLGLQQGCRRLCSIVEHHGATQQGCPHGRDKSCNRRAIFWLATNFKWHVECLRRGTPCCPGACTSRGGRSKPFWTT